MKVEIKQLKLSEIKANKENPRILKDEKYRQLKKSIQDFPEMLELREIVVDENYVILGGNMRYKVLKDLKFETVNAKIVTGLSDEQKKEFIVKDNVNVGDWDFELLSSWDSDSLKDWGLDLEFDTYENSEIDVYSYPDKIKMIFEFTQEEYSKINGALSKINANKELALLELLDV